MKKTQLGQGQLTRIDSGEPLLLGGVKKTQLGQGQLTETDSGELLLLGG